MTLQELQTKRDSLVSEIAKATASVSSGNASITKRSITELQTALAIIDGEIETAQGGAASTIGYLYGREGL